MFIVRKVAYQGLRKPATAKIKTSGSRKAWLPQIPRSMLGCFKDSKLITTEGDEKQLPMKFMLDSGSPLQGEWSGMNAYVVTYILFKLHFYKALAEAKGVHNSTCCTCFLVKQDRHGDQIARVNNRAIQPTALSVATCPVSSGH